MRSTGFSPERCVVVLALLGACGGGGGGAGTSTSGLASESGSEGGDASSGASESGEPALECEAPQVACGQLCADLDRDPSNCGACGTSCVIANAAAACEAGTCRLDECEPGFADCDGSLQNGCEIAVECEEGAACSSSCGTTGAQSCTDPCAPVCTPPTEACNAADDDCNEACDEGPLPACRTAVHRSYGGSLGHFYTTDLGEATQAGLMLEIQDYFWVYPEQKGGLGPLFRCMKPDGKRWLTSSIDCETTGAPELTLGFVAPDEQCGAMPLYRLYSAGANDHFYTVSAAERDNAIAMYGYVDQGIAGWVWPGA